SRGQAPKGVRKVARACVFRKGDGAGRRQLPNGFGRGCVPSVPLGQWDKLAGKAIHRSGNRLPPLLPTALALQVFPAASHPAGLAHSCNCRFSSSISSASAVSVLTRFSILRTACSTVVWSRPPKRRPISGSERSVSVLARYMATCRGRTTFAVRRDDKRSARLTLYCRATTR